MRRSLPTASSRSSRDSRSQRPGVEDESVVPAVKEDQIEHVERADRFDPFDERRLAVAVEGLQRKTAGVDFSTFAHELLHLAIHGEVTRERFVTELRKAALNAERDAWTVE